MLYYVCATLLSLMLAFHLSGTPGATFVRVSMGFHLLMGMFGMLGVTQYQFGWLPLLVCWSAGLVLTVAIYQYRTWYASVVSER